MFNISIAFLLMDLYYIFWAVTIKFKFPASYQDKMTSSFFGFSKKLVDQLKLQFNNNLRKIRKQEEQTQGVQWKLIS